MLMPGEFRGISDVIFRKAERPLTAEKLLVFVY